MNISTADLRRSKFMSLILRHKPEQIGVSLDEHGYIYIDELIAGMNERGMKTNINDIKRIVRQDDKQRYTIKGDMIRANQGHSKHVNLDLLPLPKDDVPEYLYHGTSGTIKSIILKDGIKKMKRQYVHLSKDKPTAITVATRHFNTNKDYVVFIINAHKMIDDNISIYKSDNGVYLIDYVDPKYIENYINIYS